ncbi:MAG: NYN domain-containing protein [Thermoguttaceae bacterium]|jgi:predicted RNA-binding protein with PIN domain|nr:NYN domain-containing protein [Thermoguttaceae bacterium]
MPGFVLIDGYNLLHATGIVARGIGPGTLERARLALLGFLAGSMTPEQLQRATIVFDAAGRQPGLPREANHRGMKVLFAAGYADADALIERLIRRHSAPRQLTVVSSDHQVQRAARRRKAKAVDSGAWYAELVASRRRAAGGAVETSGRPPVPLLQEDVEYWLRQFGGEAAIEAWLNAELNRETPAPDGHPPAGEPPTDGAPDKPSVAEADSLANPFPEGYGEDLWEDGDISP